jgi:hypothetical protein
MRVEISLVRVGITIVRVVITLVSDNTHTYQNYTVLIEITLVRNEITVVSVVITFVRVKIRKSCGNYTLLV